MSLLASPDISFIFPALFIARQGNVLSLLIQLSNRDFKFNMH